MIHTIVIGGSSGIGMQLIRELLAKKRQVTATYNTHLPNIPEVTWIKLDIYNIHSDFRSIKRIDEFIYCLGITPNRVLLETSDEEFRKTMEINTWGVIKCLKLLMNKFNNNTKILAISSLNGVLSWPTFGLYSASKFALRATLYALRYELLPKSHQVSCVLLGAFSSEKKVDKQFVNKPLREKNIVAKILFPIPSRDIVAKKIMKLLEKDTLPTTYSIGSDVFCAKLFSNLVPEWIQNILMKKLI